MNFLLGKWTPVSQSGVRELGVCPSLLGYPLCCTLGWGLSVILAVFLGFIWRLQPRSSFGFRSRLSHAQELCGHACMGLESAGKGLCFGGLCFGGSIMQESAVHSENSQPARQSSRELELTLPGQSFTSLEGVLQLNRVLMLSLSSDLFQNWKPEWGSILGTQEHDRDGIFWFFFFPSVFVLFNCVWLLIQWWYSFVMQWW